MNLYIKGKPEEWKYREVPPFIGILGGLRGLRFVGLYGVLIAEPATCSKMVRCRTRIDDLRVHKSVCIVLPCVQLADSQQELRVFSSAGRAPRLHRGCHRFDPGRTHRLPRYRKVPGFLFTRFFFTRYPPRALPITRSEGARREAHEDNPAGTVIPSGIKLQSTYI